METKLTNARVVAVDGGTATGKSRLVEELATLLRSKGVAVIHVSTGHLYRAVAFAALEQARSKVAGKRGKTAAEINQAAAQTVRQMDAATMLSIVNQAQVQLHGGMVWLNGAPALVEEQLKAPGVGAVTPHGAAFLDVRRFVDEVVRRQVNEFDGFVLIDGRDIGTGVVPDAPLKLLLTVTPQVATQRSREHTIEEIIARDEADRNRVHGPLPRAERVPESVVVLPTDDHTPESVRDYVYGLMRRAFLELPEL